MKSFTEIRQKYPQYNDLSDDQLSDAIHSKFYSDIPKDEFHSKIGFQPLNENNKLDQLKQNHPYLYKIAESLQGTPGFEKAGNIAGNFNKIFEGTGFPSM